MAPIAPLAVWSFHMMMQHPLGDVGVSGQTMAGIERCRYLAVRPVVSMSLSPQRRQGRDRS